VLTSGDIWSWSGWTWPGWGALAAAAGLVAAIGTVAAFFVIFSQLQESRREALENRHAAVTPLASIRFLDIDRTNQSEVTARLVIELVGTGLAYALRMDFSTDNQAEMKLVEFQPFRKTYPVLQPQEEWKMDVRWRKPVKRVRCKVSVSFVNPLNRTIDWVRPFVIREDGRIMGRGPTRFSIGQPRDD